MSKHEPLKIDPSSEHRFARQELIGWWDQNRLTNTKALVVGAGALGNEILKNLALLGIGKALVVDLDKIELSNLSRSVLFREEDCGRDKAVVACERAQQIYPDMQLQPFIGNVTFDLGLGVFRWADLILGGLDNREARVAINQAASKVGKPWIDGAIERLDGIARVFDPSSGPCYECTMSEIDWKMLEARRSCALLNRDEIAGGKVPTTPTTSSIIAGIQVQEAVKIAHGLEPITGKGFVFDGMSHQSYLISYCQLEDCPSHDAFGRILELPNSVTTMTVSQLLERACHDLDGPAIIELNQDLIESLICMNCNHKIDTCSSLGSVSESEALCPNCKKICAPSLYHTVDENTPQKILEKTLAEIGVPKWDILMARRGLNSICYEFCRDSNAILGALC